MARIVIYLLWIDLVFGWMYLGSLHAQPREEPQIVLARAAVGECGWLLPDCEAGIWHTLDRRRAKLLKEWDIAYTLRGMLLRYCAIFRGKHEGRRVWVRGLRPDGAQPNGWPAGASWQRHQPWWQRIYARAGDYLDGKVKDPCKGKPTHTGGLMDRANMNPEVWRAVDCGVTRTRLRAQFFWEQR